MDFASPRIQGRFWSPSTLLAALLLAAVLVLPFRPPFHAGGSDYVFAATVSSTQRGLVQLFFDLGRGFNEADSRYVAVAGDGVPRPIELPLPHGRYGALRFDPLDRAGVITVAGAAVRDYRGRVVRAFGPAQFKPIHQIHRLSAEGPVLRIETDDPADDPNLWINLDGPFTLAAVPGSLWGAYLRAVGLAWLCALLAARAMAAVAAPLWRWALGRPRSLIALVALLALLLNSHPVAFAGRSFVSPNNGALLLYNVFPTLPGYTSTAVEDNMGSDTGAVMWWHLPASEVERQAILHDHEWPLWNRYDLGGQPLLGQGQTMLGDPLHWAAAILGPGGSAEWDVRYLLAKWIFSCGIGFTVLLLTADLAAAAVLAIAAVYVGFFGFRIDHPAVFSVTYAPWLLYSWLRIHRSADRRSLWLWVAALAGADWLELNSGTIKEAYMLALSLNLTGGLLVLAGEESWSARWRRLACAGWGSLLMLLLSAPFWLTFLEALRVSMNSYEQPVAQQLPFGRLIGFFEDLFLRQDSPGERLVTPSANALALLGVVWAGAAFRAVVARRTAALLALASLVAAALVFSVVPGSWITAVPLLRNIQHIANTFSCVLLVLVLPLAGCGLAAALASARTAAWWRRTARATVGVAVLLVLYLVLNRPAQFSPFFVAYAGSLLLGAVLLHDALRRFATRNGAAPGASLLLVLGVAMLLWRQGQYLHTAFDAYVFNPQVRVDLGASSPALARTQAQSPDPSRTVGLGLNFMPGFNQQHRVEAIYGVDALRSREYVDLLKALGLGRVEDFATGDPADRDAAHRAAYDALNAEYFLDSPGLLPADSPWRHVGDWDLAVYQSKTAWPRAYFTDRVETLPDLPSLAARLRAASGPVAAVEADQPSLDPASLTKGPGAEGARVVAADHYRLTSNHTSFDLQAPGPGVAVLLESWFPGDFRATVNSREVPYFRINHAFKAVYLPQAGRYRIDFSYWPRFFTLSLELASLGAGLIAITVVLVCLGRKGQPAA